MVIHKSRQNILVKWIVVAIACGVVGHSTLRAVRGQPDSDQIFLPVTFYMRQDSPKCARAKEFLEKLARVRPEVRVTSLDVVSDLAARRRFYALVKQHQITTPGLPGIQVGHRFHIGFDQPETTGKMINDSLSFEVFTREGCPHCAKAKVFLEGLKRRHPGLQISIRDVIQDIDARNRMQYLAGQSNVQVPSLPMFWVYGKSVVGFADAAITGDQVESLVKTATSKSSKSQTGEQSGEGGKKKPEASKPKQNTTTQVSRRRLGHRLRRTMTVHWKNRVIAQTSSRQTPETDEPPPPEEAVPSEGNAPLELKPLVEPQSEEVTLPILGKVRVRDLGLPLFTIVLGLVDGFNPCAMWVLIFLLSILVNLKDRWKILCIAGTFVIVSGLAYFAFMAAWLNVFVLIGLARWAQVALGCVALLVGTVNIKDFFAFKKGLSLSIPESFKPGLYARVRNIVAAKYLPAALAGAVVLAVLVNTVELLCTAGLPAAYTNILNSRQLPWWQNYSYLGLYIGAYMFDDSIMVGIAAVTLSHRKMQEHHGRWLKLISGIVVLGIGLMMLFRPDLLQKF